MHDLFRKEQFMLVLESRCNMTTDLGKAAADNPIVS
jgi:hypothetical protein